MNALGFFPNLNMCPSPLRKVGGIQNYLHLAIRNLFLDAEMIFDEAGREHPDFEAGNLLVNIPASPGCENLSTLAVEAHVDTVELISGQSTQLGSRDGRMFIEGGGILGADDKAGVAAILSALYTVKDKPHGPLQIIFSVGEELSMYGMKAFDFTSIKAESILCVDGLAANVINNAGAGKIKYRATFKGKSGHGAFPESGLNAVEVAAMAIANCHIYSLTGRLDSGIIHNLSEIQSHEGSSKFPSTNVIPDTVIVSGELRGRDSISLEMSFQSLCARMESTASSMGAGVIFHKETPYAPFAISPDAEIIRRLKDKNPDFPFSIREDDGSTHANIFNEKGIESAVIGAGCRNPHSRDEYLIISELEKAAEIIINYLSA